jgi:hypothetical protein
MPTEIIVVALIAAASSVAPAATSRNVPSWEYGKPLKQPLLLAHLCHRTHEDSAQSTNLRYRHHSGLYLSENGDGSRCQRPVLCSHRWMTNTRSVRWMRWERPVSPRLQRRATIDPLSILCPWRGGSTSPERHFDSSFPLQLEPGGKQQSLPPASSCTGYMAQTSSPSLAQETVDIPRLVEIFGGVKPDWLNEPR